MAWTSKTDVLPEYMIGMSILIHRWNSVLRNLYNTLGLRNVKAYINIVSDFLLRNNTK